MKSGKSRRITNRRKRRRRRRRRKKEEWKINSLEEKGKETSVKH